MKRMFTVKKTALVLSAALVLGAALVLSVALILSACSPATDAPAGDAPASETPSQGSSEDAPSGPSADRLALHRNPEAGINFLYPKNWEEVSAAALDSPEALAAMQQTLGLDEAGIRQVLETTEAYFYNFADATDTFTANLSYSAADAPGATQELLASAESLAQFKAQMEQEFANVPIDNFKWLQEPSAQSVEQNNFVIAQASYTLRAQGLNVFLCQAMILHGETLYSFVYTGTAGQYNQETMAALEALFGSVTFTK